VHLESCAPEFHQWHGIAGEFGNVKAIGTAAACGRSGYLSVPVDISGGAAARRRRVRHRRTAAPDVIVEGRPFTETIPHMKAILCRRFGTPDDLALA
jgi:hypothetical protein